MLEDARLQWVFHLPTIALSVKNSVHCDMYELLSLTLQQQYLLQEARRARRDTCDIIRRDPLAQRATWARVLHGNLALELGGRSVAKS
jgi:hypothetical protein